MAKEPQHRPDHRPLPPAPPPPPVSDIELRRKFIQSLREDIKKKLDVCAQERKKEHDYYWSGQYTAYADCLTMIDLLGT